MASLPLAYGPGNPSFPQDVLCFSSMDARIRSRHDDGDEVATSPETQRCGYSFPSSRSLDDFSPYFL
jgi:hypothetical protein